MHGTRATYSATAPAPVLYAYGVFERSDTIVLGATEYREAYRPGLFRELVRKLWSQEQLVFVGFGFTDAWFGQYSGCPRPDDGFPAGRGHERKAVGLSPPTRRAGPRPPGRRRSPPTRSHLLRRLLAQRLAGLAAAHQLQAGQRAHTRAPRPPTDAQPRGRREVAGMCLDASIAQAASGRTSTLTSISALAAPT